MHCPACKNELSIVETGPVPVDVCVGGCGGMWFDQLELKRLDEPHETEGQILLDVDVNQTVTVDHEEQRHCPKCENTILMRHFYSPQRHIAVDECPECGGHWLDAGELAEIRKLYASDEERNRHFDQLIGEQFGAKLDAMAQKRERTVRRQGPTRSILGFLMPGFH